MNSATDLAFSRMSEINVALTDPTGASAAAFESGMRIASHQGVETEDILHALARGSTRKGDKLLFKTLATIVNYLSSWGAFAIIVLGLFQLVQSTAALVEKFIQVFQAIANLFGAAGKVIDFVLGKFTKKDGEGELVIKSTVALVTASVPEVGVALGICTKFFGEGKSDRVGGTVHDLEPNYGLVPVPRANFTMVDREESDRALEDAVLDIGASLGQAAIRAGADPQQLQDEIERVLHDEVGQDGTYVAMHDFLKDTLDDMADDEPGDRT